jgi:phospholipid/cholesterol/gamma-HCH transport system permease protein
VAGYLRGGSGPGLERHLPRLAGYKRLEVLGGMAALLLRTVRVAVRPPYSWRRLLIVEMSRNYRRSVIPLILSAAFFSLGLAVWNLGGIMKALGTLDRLGGGVQVGFLREASRWVAMMVVGGVVGSSITADLGAQKVREELDALKVLGIDEIRLLVVPRVLAIVLIMPIVGFAGVIAADAVAYLAATSVYAGSLTSAAYQDAYWTFAYSVDVLMFIVTLMLCGLFVGIVACYKGLNAGGGTNGVGRAVNECVLISFFGLWTIHTLLQFVTLALFPEIQVLRG